MIKHLVMWKLDESYSLDEKKAIKMEFKNKLTGLVGKVGEIKSLNIYYNDDQAPQSNYDILLDSSFNSISDLEAYQVNPFHKKVGEYIKSVKLQRVCIDYNI